MASNERENARKERARQKDKRNKRIIWFILILVIVVLAVMRVSEIDFKSIRNRYFDDKGKLTVSMTTDEDAYPYALDTSSGVRIKSVNDKLSVLTANSLTILNPSNANKLYSFDHGYANPMISYAGNYTCLVDQGGTRIRLDTNTDNLYEQSLQRTILTADVANNGTVIYATQGEKSKSSLVVLSKQLKKLMELDINDGYVVSVSIDSSGKRCAYATINSVNAVMQTTIHTINVGDDEDTAKFTYDGINVLDLTYQSSSLYVVCDNMVSVITSQKKEHIVFKNGTISTQLYTYTPSGELIIDYSDFSGANENTIAYVKPNAKVKTTINLDKRVKNISASQKEITALFNDKVINYSITKGEEKSSVQCDDSLRSADSISSKTFVQRGQMLDILE